MDNKLPVLSPMASNIRDDIDGNARKRKLYKTEGGTVAQNFARTVLQNSVSRIGDTLQYDDDVSRVDLTDTNDVKRRALEYVRACAAAGVLPGMSGLAGYAFRCSRQWIQKFKTQHPQHPTSIFLDSLGEMFADALAGAGLNGSANYIMAIFLMKNSHGYSDRIEVNPVINTCDDDLSDEAAAAKLLDDIQRRYNSE